MQRSGAPSDTGPCVKGSGGPGGGAKSCAAAPKGARGKRLGRARLGQRRRAVRRAFGRAGSYRPFTDRYCLRGGGAMRVGYPSKRALGRLSGSQRRKVRGRAILLLSSSKRTRVGGVRTGASVSALKKRPGVRRGVRVGRNVWYSRRAKGRTLVFKVRGRKVAEVGLANGGLTASRSGVERFFRFGRCVPEVTGSLEFRAAVESRDLDRMRAALADDVVFASPVVFRPYEGRQAVAHLLSTVVEVFEDFEYTDQLRATAHTRLSFARGWGTSRSRVSIT